MGRRVEEEGASEGRSVIERIEVDPSVGPEATSPYGESRQTSLWSFITREPWPTDFRERSRHVGGNNARWCGSRCCHGLARHQLARDPVQCSSAPGAYREGGSGGQ